MFSTRLTPSGVYKMSKGSFDNSIEVYYDMTTDGGGWIVVIPEKKKQ